jgi:hypothetical protein
LRSAQVALATQLHERLDQWRLTDEALRRLRERLPENDVPSTLVKVAALNQLYGTNLYAISNMAKHIVSILGEPKIPDDLVERIARLPPREGTKQRNHLSFASKFAHFFVDETFPIFDSYAEKVLWSHVRRPHGRRDYGTYRAAHRALVQHVGEGCTSRKLDRYLWLSGLYRAWKADRAKAINVEVRQLLEAATPKELADFDAMVSG